MEMANGGQCNDIFKHEDKPLKEMEIRAVAQGTLRALVYLHGQRIVHRDIKPENILVGPYGEVLVLDWGMAKVWHKEKEQEDGGRGAEVEGEKGALQHHVGIGGEDTDTKAQQGLGEEGPRPEWRIGCHG